MKLEEIITDEQIKKAWGNANFGKEVNKRDVIKYSLLKYASGYVTGHTVYCILLELLLINIKEELTPRGKNYLYYSFENKNNSF